MKTPRLLAALLMAQAGHALAEDNAQGKGFWYAQTSVYTRHYSPDPEHNNHQDLIGIERNQASGWVFGGATFRNSFRQRSNYAYVGKRYDSSEYPLYLKVTGGLLQGYRGDYKDKIPLNRYGVAPVIIPSVGTHYGPLAAELVFLGANAAMVTSGVRF
ncbi:sn-glycerol-3-phosphate transporter [Pseudomonas fluorescens]|uniref:sn-glycerol-3-phosphate transporter n=1 Tax=Pseudomonas fluorescens TaxID=294 RepID=UPI000F471A23|nr:sn-glycerol-3-phosphate transporter [Pseudomonas fluorescens]RON92794.1 sn-glycerol-3-phosphate transporter [Pseudomonas fluorescens]